MSRKTKGFTLIELLAVIAIIGILASLAVVGISNALKRARDSRRESDLSNIKRGLELYFNDNGTFPAETGIKDALQTDGNYMQAYPKDPKGGEYTYIVDSDAQNFVLYTDLEYKKTKATLSTTNDDNSISNCEDAKSTAKKGNGVVTASGQSCFRLTND